MNTKDTIKLGIIMDSITNINIKKDSSFAILLEAQARGYDIYYMEIPALYLKNNKAYALARLINVYKNYNKWYEFNSTLNDILLSDLDIILMRKDPPCNNEYIYCTYILEYAESEGTLIINKPQSLRDCNEKIFTTWFHDVMPDTLVSSNKLKLQEFWMKHRNIILKPLNGMGGRSIFYIKDSDPNFNVITELMTKNYTQYCMAQKYIDDIVSGDKRILIIDGKPIPYCLVRIPKHGEIRGNLAVGAHSKIKELTKNDWYIANYIGKTLKDKSLIFAGIDIIGNYLTEINVTSPTGICEIEKSTSVSITSILMNVIEMYLRK